MLTLADASHYDLLIDFTNRNITNDKNENYKPVYYYFKCYVLYRKNQIKDYNMLFDVLSAQYPEYAKKLWFKLHNFKNPK